MKPAIDITDEQWVLLSSRLRRFLPDVEVWAHGSRVKCTARPTSDLDLVAFCTPGDRSSLSQLKDALAESSLPFVVDLLVWADVPARFHENIRLQHVVIQEAAQQENTLSQRGRWPIRTVEELSRAGVLVIGDGYRAKNSELSTAGIPFARAGNINNGFDFKDADRFPEGDLSRVGNKVSQPGDVVFTSKGTVGRFAFVRPETPRFVYSPQLCFWRSAKPEILDPRFLYYWMLGREFYVQFKGVSGQTDMAEYVSLSDQRRMYLTMPPTMAEQRAIASVLGALDDKIESNRRTSRALERVARALFRAWFVDFEPVKAKAAGAREFPGMPPETFAALPSRFVDSELGPVPEGWAVRPLDAVVEVNPSRRLAKGVLASYLDMGQMPTDGHAPASWVKREAGSGARFMNGDTLVARITPCLENGKTAFVDFLADGEVAWGSTEYIVLRPKPPIPDLYAYLLARTPEFRAFAIRNMSGTSGRQRVPFTTMNKFNVAIGSEAVMSAFGETVAPLFARSSAGVSESRRLATLRDYLLPKLLSGAVRATVKSRLKVRSEEVPA